MRKLRPRDIKGLPEATQLVRGRARPDPRVPSSLGLCRKLLPRNDNFKKQRTQSKEISKAKLTSSTLGFSLTSYREFFGQGWMKLEKNERTPYIMKTTKHFNDVSMGVGERVQCLSLQVSLR